MKGRMGSSLTTEISQEEVSVQYAHKLCFHDQKKPVFCCCAIQFNQLGFIEETFQGER